MLDDHEFHVVLSDQRMPRISGVEFFELIMPDHPDISRVLVTGYADTDAVVDAINKGQVYRFVSKPWNEEELRGVIKAAHALNRVRVNSARQGHQVLSALDGFAAEAGRLHGMAQSAGDGLSHALAADLRQLEEGIRAERVRYGKWMEAQKGKG
jgi:FixJ family two-component response regulator